MWLELIKNSRTDHKMLSFKFKNKSTEHPLLWLISLTTAGIRNDIFPNIKNLATFLTIKIKHNVQHRRHECGKTSPINNKCYDHYPIARYASDIPKRGASPRTSHQNLSVTLPNLNEWSAYKTNTYPVCMGGKLLLYSLACFSGAFQTTDWYKSIVLRMLILCLLPLQQR